MEHHADFAVPVHQVMEVTTDAQPDDGLGPLQGRVVALGWWVDPDAESDPGHRPTGTLYLVVDERRSRPYWVRQAALRSIRMQP